MQGFTLSLENSVLEKPEDGRVKLIPSLLGFKQVMIVHFEKDCYNNI